MKILVITSCSNKKKEIIHPKTIRADQLYEGQFFRMIRAFARKNEYDFGIISAKYGFIMGDEQISHYNKKIATKSDAMRVRKMSRKKLLRAFKHYDRILSFMGKKYMQVLDDFLTTEKLFYAVDHQGIGGWNRLGSLVNRLKKEYLIRKLCEEHVRIFSKEDLEKWFDLE